MKKLNEEYELCRLENMHIEILYKWSLEERYFEYYTCRPLKEKTSLEEYTFNIIKSISNGDKKIYVLVKKENKNIPLGKIVFFDWNPRNHSGEFGYYLPQCNRGQGLGEIMISKFVESYFMDEKLNLNKLYATTASNNTPSSKILQKLGFNLDGSLREHYWINNAKYDQLVYSILKVEWISQ